MKSDGRDAFSSSIHIARLTCIYCNNIINRSDAQCPHCGAETASSIQSFMEQEKAETEQCERLMKSLDKSLRHRVIGLVCALFAVIILSVLLFVFIRQKTVKLIHFTLLVSAYAVYLVAGITGIIKMDSERRRLYKTITGLSGKIIFACEEIQPYKMINDSNVTNEGCCKEGFQQIACKVSITNGSSKTIDFTLYDEFFAEANAFGYHVRLNADGVRMEDCKLAPFFHHHEENNIIFEPLLYTQGFKKIVLRPQESLVGWVGFYMVPKARNLELLFADEYVMLKNPALAADELRRS